MIVHSKTIVNNNWSVNWAQTWFKCPGGSSTFTSSWMSSTVYQDSLSRSTQV